MRNQNEGLIFCMLPCRLILSRDALQLKPILSGLWGPGGASYRGDGSFSSTSSRRLSDLYDRIMTSRSPRRGDIMQNASGCPLRSELAKDC